MQRYKYWKKDLSDGALKFALISFNFFKVDYLNQGEKYFQSYKRELLPSINILTMWRRFFQSSTTLPQRHCYRWSFIVPCQDSSLLLKRDLHHQKSTAFVVAKCHSTERGDQLPIPDRCEVAYISCKSGQSRLSTLVSGRARIQLTFEKYAWRPIFLLILYSKIFHKN